MYEIQGTTSVDAGVIQYTLGILFNHIQGSMLSQACGKLLVLTNDIQASLRKQRALSLMSIYQNMRLLPLCMYLLYFIL